MKFYTSFFQRGSNLYVRGYTESGVQVQNSYPIKPKLWTETERPNVEAALSMYDTPVYAHSFNDPRSARDFINTYKGTNMRIWGYPRFDYALINELFPGEIHATKDDIRVVAIDIETEVAGPDDIHMDSFPNVFNPKNPINLITMSYRGRYFTFGCIPYENSDKDVAYILCKDEADLLTKWFALYKQINPDVITGWNINKFDLPYIYNRAVNILGDDRLANTLSPFNWVRVNETNFRGRAELELEVSGLAILDYLELYLQFNFTPRENYKLDTITHIELGENKVQYECTFRELYLNHWQEKFVPYNIQDVKLIDNLDDKLGFIELSMIIAHMSKCNMIDVYRATRIWDNVIANYMVEQGKHVITDYNHVGGGYEGAYVKPTIPGLYDLVAGFDFSALYPNLIIQYNISPDTILPAHLFPNITPNDILERNSKYQGAIEIARQNNATLCANGSMYRRDKQGFIPYLLDRGIKDRKASQKIMREARSNIEKAQAELKRRGVA